MDMSHFAAFGLGALFVALVGLAGVFVFLAGASRQGRRLDADEDLPIECTPEELGAQELEQRVDNDNGQKGSA